ncbi:hypothetical protein CLOP_g14448 [Closterium sp. NIES-67]|nr:hypothetical protein CLOP_g14448 [Closterium sp. NIES-67]
MRGGKRRRENLGTSEKNQGITEGVPRHSSQRPSEQAAAIPNAPTRDRGRTMFEADLPSTISAQPHGASRHEKTDRVSSRKMTHPTTHFAIRCPSTLHTETRRKPVHVNRLPSSQQADHQEQIPNSTNP